MTKKLEAAKLPHMPGPRWADRIEEAKLGPSYRLAMFNTDGEAFLAFTRDIENAKFLSEAVSAFKDPVRSAAHDLLKVAKNAEALLARVRPNSLDLIEIRAAIAKAEGK